MKRSKEKRKVSPVNRPAAGGRSPARQSKSSLPVDPARIYRDLLAMYPDAHCALNHKNPFELLVATILSAQCTDVRVNMVTPDLFRRFPTVKSLAEAELPEIEEVVRSTGFYRNKAKNIRGAARLILERFGGRVPDTMDDLLHLPGVARKTANVVLGNAYGKNEGVVVDTHISRLSKRLGLTTHTDPVKIERDLALLFPREQWTMLAHLLIHHGRVVCEARKPRCNNCPLAAYCPKNGVDPKWLEAMKSSGANTDNKHR
ncbi:MAG: endonuclease III [Planctomycetes bacterium]|nr:endonuclease III [Planctomycetota bacterium]